MTMLLEYNPLLDAQKVVNFDKGFYALEQDRDNQWIWAFDDGVINIKSLSNSKVKLTISLRAASKRKITFEMNGEAFEEEFVDSNIKDVTFITNLKEGSNELKVTTDTLPIRLSETDLRDFSYAIFDISVENIDSLEVLNEKYK